MKLLNIFNWVQSLVESFTFYGGAPSSNGGAMGGGSRFNPMQGAGVGIGNNALYGFNDSSAMSPVGKMLFSKMPQSARSEFINSGMGSFFGLQKIPMQQYYTSSGNLESSYGGSVPQQRTGDGRTISQGMPQGMATMPKGLQGLLKGNLFNT